MNLLSLRSRLAWIGMLLRRYKIMPKDQKLEPKSFDELNADVKHVELFVAARKNHALHVMLFRDEAIALVLKTTFEEPTFIMLVRPPEEELWSVQVANNYPDQCSSELFNLWSTFPPRKDVDAGLFSRRRGLLALHLMLQAFVNIPEATDGDSATDTDSTNDEPRLEVVAQVQFGT